MSDGLGVFVGGEPGMAVVPDRTCISRHPTPLLPLDRHSSVSESPILLKPEWSGPTGSAADTLYAHLFSHAQACGDLTADKEVLEAATGPSGVACASVAAQGGYRCTVVLPRGVGGRYRSAIERLGAAVLESAGGESDLDLAVKRVVELNARCPDRYWIPRQFDNPQSVAAFDRTLGPEIWEQTTGRIGAFLAPLGLAGLFSGVGRYLRQRNPDIALYAVEPAECPLLARREWGHHVIAGAAPGFVPRVLDLALLSGVVSVTAAESCVAVDRFALSTGTLIGLGGGAAIAAALKLARRHPDVGPIVTIVDREP